MLKYFRTWLTRNSPNQPSEEDAPATALPTEIVIDGAPSFPVAQHLTQENGFTFLDWDAAIAWIGELEPEQQDIAWGKCEAVWLEHLGTSLGPNYKLKAKGEALLLSSLGTRTALATLTLMNKTLQRILRILDGIAQIPEWGKDILIVFDDADAYYRYVAHYYPQAGEFAFSSGMYINGGCGHFATIQDELLNIEPVIAHELAHSCVSHLPLPTWINEGLAVNTEYQLYPPVSAIYTPAEMHQKHLHYWGETEIQEFWSGKSFLRTDDGNLLSYDLARILITQLSKEWLSFCSFVQSARPDDAGAASAAAHQEIDLGATVCALLERAPSPAWSPNSALWK